MEWLGVPLSMRASHDNPPPARGRFFEFMPSPHLELRAIRSLYNVDSTSPAPSDSIDGQSVRQLNQPLGHLAQNDALRWPEKRSRRLRAFSRFSAGRVYCSVMLGFVKFDYAAGCEIFMLEALAECMKISSPPSRPSSSRSNSGGTPR